MTILKKIRFFDNQFIDESNSTASSEDASYPYSNALNTIRSKLYRPTSNVWYIEWDFGWNADITFFGAIGKLSETFTVSEQATITLKANNIPSMWSSPPFEETITASDYAMYLQIDKDLSGYRYWRLDVDDSSNATQNEIGYIFLGNHVEVTERDINAKYSKTEIDPSIKTTSINGTQYYDERIKYLRIQNLGLGYMPADERRELEQMFYDFGKHDPFFCSLDPTLSYSTYDWELTRFFRFAAEPMSTNWYGDVFSMSFSLDEVI